MKEDRNEIDLLELLFKIYFYLKKYAVILVAAVIAAVLVTFAANIYDKKEYKSSMILSVKQDNDYMYAVTMKEVPKRFEKNPAEAVTGIIMQADNIIKNGNFETLSRKMNIPVAKLKGLKSITAEYSLEKNSAPGNIVKINAEANNTEIFEILGKGVLNMIEENPFIKDKYDNDSVFLANVIANVENKIKKIDSLQSKYLKTGNADELILFKNESFFGEAVSLSSLKAKLLKELSDLQQAQIVEDFFVPQKTSGKSSFLKTLIINIIIFLFSAVIIISFIVFNQKAKEYQKTKNKN
ncbi:MAG: hypothetical protein GXO50_01745 [Chlorobi bacterium]|nr:hypothetical protein [Chlorobiota bacterium]